MIELIRSSSVPANLMQSAARGALSVPADEMIEILVHIANHNKVFGTLARMTLAGWDEKSCLTLAASPQAPQEVLEYWTASDNLRPCLLPALLENTAISEETLTAMAAAGSKDVVEAMRQSTRAQQIPAVVRALASNPNVPQHESAQLEEKAQAAEPSPTVPSEPGAEASVPDDHDEAVTTFLADHASELAAEADKPFQPVGGMYELEESRAEEAGSAQAEASQPAEEHAPKPATTPTAGAAVPAASAPNPKPAKKPQPSPNEERGSVLQKIAKLDVKGRIQLAMKGNKEERAILVRDGTKLVALAVLESGKITDGEVEKIASQKNVLEAVLRQIPMKRRFMKNYNVVRNLVANPRTPLDVSLGLMKNILAIDLKNLSGNKDVPETIRKLALKMFKQKTETAKKS